MECVRVPLVPVTVSGYEPNGVFATVAIAKVEVPEPVMELGVNVAVAPVGRPVTVRLTAPEKPLRAPTDTV